MNIEKLCLSKREKREINIDGKDICVDYTVDNMIKSILKDCKTRALIVTVLDDIIKELESIKEMLSQ